MSRELTYVQKVEQSISKKYHDVIWSRFTLAVRNYRLINEGDRIAVCISGGKDSMLMAKLIQMLQKYGKVDFEAKYLVMDPGYNKLNREKIEHNAGLLEITRGVSGGSRLSSPPGQIRILDVILALGEDVELISCMDICGRASECEFGLDRRFR